MSVVDAPPGRDFAGPALGEFRSRVGPKKLARAAFWMTSLGAVATLAAVRESWAIYGTSTIVVLSLVCVSIAGVGLLVRKASVRIDAGGLQWGWGGLGARVGPARIDRLRYYEKGMVVVRSSGSPWYLSGYDWDRYGEMPKVCEDAGLTFERCAGRPPLRARMQAYGVVLDALVVGALVASALLLAIAALR